MSKKRGISPSFNIMIKCKICSDPEVCKKVERLLSEGITQYQIVKQTPNISRDNLRNHMRHMPKNNDDELIKHREQLEKVLKAGTGDFTSDMRVKLETLCRLNSTLIEDAMNECLQGQFSRKLGEYTNTFTKLMDKLNDLSGFKEQVSIDTAIDTVTRAGYEITNMTKEEEKTDKVAVTPERFKQYMEWLKVNEA